MSHPVAYAAGRSGRIPRALAFPGACREKSPPILDRVETAAAAIPAAAMSIDVEDWFQVENLKSAIARDTWRTRQLRVERNMDRMLGLMSERGVHATCFILGWIAHRCPALVKRIAEEGHEIASHGYGHELLDTLTPDRFRADVARSRALLQELTGSVVRGYRAPAFSIQDWSIPILEEAGFSYDSSSFPIVAHDRYGQLTGLTTEQTIVELRPGFHEVSVSCLQVGAKALPWGGGGYFRLVPYPVFRQGIRRILSGGQPYVFYIHPWEIDADQPRVEGIRGDYRFRHYVGLRKCESRFAALLKDFRWCTIGELVAAEDDTTPATSC